MTIEITILGSGSAMPAKNRHPTAQAISIAGKNFLFDCGEGTQMQLRKYKVSMQRIQAIFISHAHSDHFLGLPGLISSMGMLGRSAKLEIHCPLPVQAFLEAYFQACEIRGLPFSIQITPYQIENHFVLYETEKFQIEAIPVEHSVPCVGFILREKLKQRGLRKNVKEQYKLGIEDILSIKNGKDWLSQDGKLIPNEELTNPPSEPRSYAFLTDTRFVPENAERVGPVDLLYHEATFEGSLAQRASATCHSTAAQAATFAQLCGAKKLIIGHFSGRYRELSPLLEEARAIFPETDLAEEGLKFSI